MLKRMLTILSLCLISTLSLALGLGPIKVQSYLNQKLVAEIPLLFMQNVRLGDIEAHLASAKSYMEIGLPVPADIPGLQIVVTKNAQGKPVIRLTTEGIITDPAISFLLHVLWPNGNLYREYAILLDPQTVTKQVIIQAVIAKPIQHNKPSQEIPLLEASGIPNIPIKKGKIDNSNYLRQKGKESPVIPPQGIYRYSPKNNDSSFLRPEKLSIYAVRSGDNVHRIAEKFQHNQDKEVKESQSMVAIYEANPQAFTFDNINKLKSGAHLTIPTEQTMQSISSEQAQTMLNAENQQWSELNSKHFTNKKNITSVIPQIHEFPATQVVTKQIKQSNKFKPLNMTSASIENFAPSQLPSLIQTRSADNHSNSNTENLQQKLALTITALNSVEQNEALTQLQLEDLHKQNEALQQQLIARDKNLLALEQQLQTLSSNKPANQKQVTAIISSTQTNLPNNTSNNFMMWLVVLLFSGLLAVIMWLMLKLKQTQILLVSAGKQALLKDYVQEVKENIQNKRQEP